MASPSASRTRVAAPAPLGRAGLVAAALALLLTAGPAAAVIPCAAMNPPWPWRPKDFCLVRRGDELHLFYTRHDDSSPPRFGEQALGHAVSRDFYHWEQRPPVLDAGAGQGAHDRIWAPCVLESNGLYWMYYTSVRDDGFSWNGRQHVAMAVSPDLEDWTPLESLRFDCAKVPWALCDPAHPATGDFRDGSAIPDPRPPHGAWTPGFLLLYVTHPADDAIAANTPPLATVGDPGHVTYVVGVAAAPRGNPAALQDLGPLWITHRDHPGSGQPTHVAVESPTLIRHALGDSVRWLLLFGAGGAYADSLAFAVASDPFDTGSWTWGGPLAGCYAPGAAAFVDRYGGVQPPDEWAAPEHFTDADGREYLAVFTRFGVEIRQLRWTGLASFTLEQPFHASGLTWSRAGAIEGGAVRLTISARNAAPDERGPRRLRFEVVPAGGDGDEPPVDPAAYGLPPEVTLAGDTTTVVWRARCPAAANGAGASFRLRVAGTPSMVSAVFTVFPRPGRSPHPRVEEPAVPAAEPDGAPVGPPPALRALPEAGGARVALDLPASGGGEVAVFDVGGRRVRTLHRGPLAAGSHGWRWDGRGDDGARLPAGVYFASARLGGAPLTARVALLR